MAEVRLQVVQDGDGANAGGDGARRVDDLETEPGQIHHGHEDREVILHHKARVDPLSGAHHVSLGAADGVDQERGDDPKQGRGGVEACVGLPLPPLGKTIALVIEPNFGH